MGEVAQLITELTEAVASGEPTKGTQLGTRGVQGNKRVPLNNRPLELTHAMKKAGVLDAFRVALGGDPVEEGDDARDPAYLRGIEETQEIIITLTEEGLI